MFNPKYWRKYGEEREKIGRSIGAQEYSTRAGPADQATVTLPSRGGGLSSAEPVPGQSAILANPSAGTKSPEEAKILANFSKFIIDNDKPLYRYGIILGEIASPRDSVKPTEATHTKPIREKKFNREAKRYLVEQLLTENRPLHDDWACDYDSTIISVGELYHNSAKSVGQDSLTPHGRTGSSVDVESSVWFLGQIDVESLKQYVSGQLESEEDTVYKPDVVLNALNIISRKNINGESFQGARIGNKFYPEGLLDPELESQKLQTPFMKQPKNGRVTFDLHTNSRKWAICGLSDKPMEKITFDKKVGVKTETTYVLEYLNTKYKTALNGKKRCVNQLVTRVLDNEYAAAMIKHSQVFPRAAEELIRDVALKYLDFPPMEQNHSICLRVKDDTTSRNGSWNLTEGGFESGAQACTRLNIISFGGDFSEVQTNSLREAIQNGTPEIPLFEDFLQNPLRYRHDCGVVLNGALQSLRQSSGTGLNIPLVVLPDKAPNFTQRSRGGEIVLLVFQHLKLNFKLKGVNHKLRPATQASGMAGTPLHMRVNTAHVRAEELPQIQDACTKYFLQIREDGNAGIPPKAKWEPKITLFVVTKRHHSRFYEVKGDENVEPGTIVDTEIIPPSQTDFYLQSHASPKGTARSAHYMALERPKLFQSVLPLVFVTTCDSHKYKPSTSPPGQGETSAEHETPSKGKGKGVERPESENSVVSDEKTSDVPVSFYAEDENLWKIARIADDPNHPRLNTWRPDLDDVMFYI
ncbi:hypothetical protein G7Y89_g1029 [Cudoniella acicularis]|uniref:Piwi domain-containing protein n=1 Tax=Cudoniella acicularis TaxID=354080 RepID=A0A8H4W8C2_9HELO|nr:hypothetical protein G7Y89_g1029 [Cudoniella acicularis]